MEQMDNSRRAPPLPRDSDIDRDQIVVLRGISWEQYVAINDAQPGRWPRLSYLDGELELMTVSPRHEIVKKWLARLVEAYAEEANIALNGYGGTTWRNETTRAAAEADESYACGKLRKTPDLIVEVVHTSGGINKLEVYRRLGVREVWFWINGLIYAYVLDGTYRETQNSIVLPGIDLDELARIISSSTDEEQTAAVRAYRESLKVRAGTLPH
jgi:Uma2 family endonuclease